MQGREIARFNKTYSVDASTASEGVVVYEGDNGRHGFVNAEGKRVVGPYFNKLGRCATARGASSAAASCTATSTSPAATPSRPRSPGPTISARAAPWRGVATSSCTSTRAAGRRLVLAGLRRRRHPGRAAARDAGRRSPAPTPPACNTRRPPKPPPDSHDLTPDSPHPPGLRRRRAGPALAAQAQQYWHASCAYDAPSPLATGGFYDGESDAVSGCIRSISEGRAAVLLPSALRSIKRVPTDTSLRGHAWGFLDGQGRLAVKPIFDRSAISITGWPPCSGKASGAISTPAAAWPSRRASTKFPISSRPGWRSSRWTASARSSTARASRPATRSTRPWTTRSCRTACPRG